jgi:hypothetical protein
MRPVYGCGGERAVVRYCFGEEEGAEEEEERLNSGRVVRTNFSKYCDFREVFTLTRRSSWVFSMD